MNQNKCKDYDWVSLADKLQERLTGSWMTQAIHVAAELGIADLLAEGPRTSNSLAAATNSHAPSLHRLLLALVTIDICKELEDGTFEITPLGALLRTDNPASLRSWIIWWGHYLWPVWGNLLYSIRTGESARKLLSGAEGFEHLEQDPESATVFGQVTIELTRITAQYIIQAYDFSGFKKVIDIGGGYGELLASILKAYPSTSGLLFDLPYAIEGARQHIEKAHLNGRYEFVAGDFFSTVPGGADVYILKSVIHDWNNERSTQILKVCRQAMDNNSRLLLIEQILPAHREISTPHQVLSRHDLTMLVACGAQERTESEYDELLVSSGFYITRIIPAGPTFSIIEALPHQ